MVDLVKIRKKKAKAAAEAAQSGEGRAESGEASATPESAEGRAQSAETAPQAPPVVEPPTTSNQQPTTNNEQRTTSNEQRRSKLDQFKETAGKRREAEAAQIAESEQALHELLTFTIADEHYAVDIERIVEIVTPRAVTRIPNADPSIVGIISLRGTIVTLVDVRRKLRHPPAGEPTLDTRIVVIDFQREIIGFLVDRVLRVVKADTGSIEPHPVVHAAELDDSIRGVFRAGGALTILLDLDKLLDHRALAAKTA